MKAINSELQEDAEKIIKKCKVCTVGLADIDGTPYVVPMNFGYHDGCIYLHSAPSGTHLDILSRNNRVCINFVHGQKLVNQHPEVACSYSMRSDSAMCRGSVEFVYDIQEKTRLMNILMGQYTDKEFTYSLPAITHVKIWKVKVITFTSRCLGLSHKEYLDKKGELI